MTKLVFFVNVRKNAPFTFTSNKTPFNKGHGFNKVIPQNWKHEIKVSVGSVSLGQCDVGRKACFLSVFRSFCNTASSSRDTDFKVVTGSWRRMLWLFLLDDYILHERWLLGTVQFSHVPW